MRHRSYFATICNAAASTAIALAIASPAWAQQDENNEMDSDAERHYASDDYDSQDRETSRSQQSDDGQRQRDHAGFESEQRYNQRDQQARQQGRDRSQRVRLEPLGWVRVATDYDNDGQYDHVDWIYYYDLQTAQERSRQRDREQQQARSSRGQQQQRSVRVRGEIQDMRTVTMSDGDDAIVATIQTDQGDARRVCFGPRNRVALLDLQEGDRVTVEGHRARLNDRRIVMADRISANGETVNLPRRESLRRLSGEVLSKRTTTFRNRDGQFVVAEIRTDDGRTRTVNLGRQRELEQLDLQEGDRVTVLGRPTTIDGEAGLIARRISANDQYIRVGQSQTDGQQSR